MSNLLTMTGLTICDNRHNELLHNIDFSIEKGLVNVLIGESGSGKTLTAKSLVQNLPYNLKLHYHSMSINGEQVNNIHPYLGQTIGFISQDYVHSLNSHTKIGQQLIAIYRYHYQVSKASAQKYVFDALSRVHLDVATIMKQYTFNLSGGQLARVQIASVIMLQPQLIIADEPIASLDVITGRKIMELLSELVKEQDVTLLIITHNLSHVLRFSDVIQVMRQGTIVGRFYLNEMQAQHLTNYTQNLFKQRSKIIKDETYDSIN